MLYVIDVVMTCIGCMMDVICEKCERNWMTGDSELRVLSQSTEQTRVNLIVMPDAKCPPLS